LPREARSVFRNDGGFSGGGARPANVLLGVAVAVAVAVEVAAVVNDAPLAESHKSSGKYRRFHSDTRDHCILSAAADE
jgi:hypothetical protein